MLRQVAEGVLVHESEFLHTNAVVVQGRAGVLLIDPGVRGDEMACLAKDLSDLGQTVVAGFSTHPHCAKYTASTTLPRCQRLSSGGKGRVSARTPTGVWRYHCPVMLASSTSSATSR